MAGERYGGRIAGIGVDTWGVDYALLDAGGRLLGDPYQYRDSRTEGTVEALARKPGQEFIFEQTGIQFMFFNTLNQLVAEKKALPGRLELANQLLFLPDLFNYWLCGRQVQERTISSTSQLWNPRTQAWSKALIEALELPQRLFQPVTDPGTVLGPLRDSVRQSTGLGIVPVIAVAGHDTASAVAGTPLSAEAPAFLSSGTWSLMGIESPQPIINSDVLSHGFSNEAGVCGTTRLLKNMCGMWIVEQLRAEWSKQGQELDYARILAMADEAKPFQAFIDPDDSRFIAPGDMASRLSDFCRATGQQVPTSKGGLLRIVFESLACKYRINFDRLEAIVQRPLPSLRIVGGGSRNTFLNQATANALGRPVRAGPVEATCVGNLLMQMMATGLLQDLQTGRQWIDRSFECHDFTPQDCDAWQDQVERLRQYCANNPPVSR